MDGLIDKNMALFTAQSRFGKSVRLTETIWFNWILKEHPEFGRRTEFLDEVRKTIEEPDYIIQGWEGELLALRWCEIALKTPKRLCIVYRELEGDGFVITAFFISRFGRLFRRNVLWQKT
jgi:hypothetical protein